MPSVEVERVCQGCGCGYSEDDASSTDGDFCSDCCCWECVSERDSDDESPGGILHSYDYVPSLFWWERSGPRPRPTTATPYLGVELEVEAGTMGALSQVVDSAEGSYPAQYWCKHDGSLYDYGCEIVTHPATLEAHREQMAWPDVLGKLRTLRVRSWDTDTCGLHVHISRDSMTRSQLWRFARLIDGNRRQMESLAGRNSGQWASYDPTNSHETIIGKKEQYNAFRYSAVNLSNDNTVEVRIFRGSIAPAHVFGAIELVSAVRDYARSLTYGDVQSGALAWRHFNAYAHDCRESYPALVERIDERVCA